MNFYAVLSNKLILTLKSISQSRFQRLKYIVIITPLLCFQFISIVTEKMCKKEDILFQKSTLYITSSCKKYH